jgi:hypothetical protein
MKAICRHIYHCNSASTAMLGLAPDICGMMSVYGSICLSFSSCLCLFCFEIASPMYPSLASNLKSFWLCLLSAGIDYMCIPLQLAMTILVFYCYCNNDQLALFIYFLEFEFEASCLLGGHSTTWATPPALFFFFVGFFWDTIFLRTICPGF